MDPTARVTDAASDAGEGTAGLNRRKGKVKRVYEVQHAKGTATI